MAIDPNPAPPVPTSSPTPAIDNEFPAYRAISSAAVASLVLGIASIFCFASLWFLVLAIGSVLLGMIALRNIRRVPDILTGASFAKVGMALALTFGASSTTRSIAQEVMGNLDARRFATHYVDVIRSESISSALWYQQPPEYRKTKNPAEIVEELKKTKSQMGSDIYTERASSVIKMKDRLRGQGEKIQFSKIESKIEDGLTTYANALIEFDGPGSKDFPEKEQFALLEMIHGDGGWMVKNVTFPYSPASTVATAPHKADDGHGH